MAKPTKTRAELEAMLMEELRQFPECSNVEAVAITRPLGRPWDIAIIRDGPHMKPECRARAREIADRLCEQYDLDGAK